MISKLAAVHLFLSLLVVGQLNCSSSVPVAACDQSARLQFICSCGCSWSVSSAAVHLFLWLLVINRLYCNSSVPLAAFDQSTQLPSSTASSFESLCFKLSLSRKSFNFLSVYRPPSGSVSSFLDEFSDLLAVLCSQPAELIISGDFNFHVNDSSSSHTRSFLKRLESFSLKQHVNFTTHYSGHSLDLVITCSSSSSLLSNIHSHFPALSDHDAVIATISVPYI